MSVIDDILRQGIEEAGIMPPYSVPNEEILALSNDLLFAIFAGTAFILIILVFLIVYTIVNRRRYY